jgi:hypothetical protein
MTLAQIREILARVRIQNTLLYGETIVVKGLSAKELGEIILLAQSQLCELESRAAQPLNPS